MEHARAGQGISSVRGRSSSGIDRDRRAGTGGSDPGWLPEEGAGRGAGRFAVLGAAGTGRRSTLCARQQEPPLFGDEEVTIPPPVVYPESDGKPMADNTRQ